MRVTASAVIKVEDALFSKIDDVDMFAQALRNSDVKAQRHALIDVILRAALTSAANGALEIILKNENGDEPIMR